MPRIAFALTVHGARVEVATETTMLAVDVPAEVELDAIIALLDAAVSLTCNYEIASTSKGAQR